MTFKSHLRHNHMTNEVDFITADGDCSHTIKRHLLLGRKAMTNLDSILKSKDITLPKKVCLSSQSYGFPSTHVWIWELEYKEVWFFGWVQRTNAFELWCWRRFLRVPWTARSNQLILKEISPEYSLEGLMLKLKLQYFPTWCEELAHWKRPWCWERLKAGGEGDDRGWDGWMASLIWWTWVSVSSGSWWWTGEPGVLQSMGSQSWTQLSDWTELNEVEPPRTENSTENIQHLKHTWLRVRIQWKLIE